MARMRARFRCVLGAMLVGLLALPVGAGSLDPPDGPLTPTMKPLSDIEPRVCVNDLPAAADAIHVIDQPGQYFLRADVHGKGGSHGILVLTDGDVSIDLNGFSLIGAPSSLDAIHVDGGTLGTVGASLRIQGGGHGTGGGGAGGMVRVRAWGGDGIHVENVRDVACAGLTIEDCAGYAIQSLHTEHIVHRDIAARNCLLGGMRSSDIGQGAFGKVYKAFERCVVEDCPGNGIDVECIDDSALLAISSTTISSSGADGVRLVLVSGGAGASSSVSIDDVRCVSSGADGLHVEIPRGSSMSCDCSHLRCIGNADDGMSLTVTGQGAPHKGAACTVSQSDFSGNGAVGCKSENPLYVDKSTFSQNPLAGLQASQDDAFDLACQADNCMFTRNGSSGAHVPRGRFSPTFCQISDGLGNGVDLDDGCLLMTSCSVTHNAGDGVSVHGTLTVNGSNFRRNAGAGVRCADGSCSAERMLCEYNGTGPSGGPGAEFTDCVGVTLARCEFNDNNGDGVRCSSGVGPVRWMAPESLSKRNAGNGFNLNNCDGAQLVRCIASGNALFGIRCGQDFTGGRVEACACPGNGGAIYVQGAGNLIVGNSGTTGAIGGFVIGQGNAAGPVIDSAGLAADCNPRSNVLY